MANSGVMIREGVGLTVNAIFVLVLIGVTAAIAASPSASPEALIVVAFLDVIYLLGVIYHFVTKVFV